MRSTLPILWLAAALSLGCGRERSEADLESPQEAAPVQPEAARLEPPADEPEIVRSPAATQEPAQADAAPHAERSGFRVRLVDGGGQPVAGATLRAALADFDADVPRYAFGNFEWEWAESRGEILARTASDADGWSALPGLPANTRILVGIRAQGFTDHQFHALTPGPGAAQELPPITLHPGREVRIRFVDDGDAGIAGLDFRCSAQQIVPANFLTDDRDFGDWLESPITYDWPDDEHRGVTDAEGWSVLPGLPVHECAVLVWDPRFQQEDEHFIPVPAGVAEHTVRLKRGAVITGRIRQANGQPVAGAELTLDIDRSIGGREVKEGDVDSHFHSSHPSFTERSEIRSDADGHFVLPSGASSEELVTVFAYLDPDLHFAFPLTRKRADLDCVIPNLCQLTGRISGLPDAGQCRLRFWNYRGLMDQGSQARCDVAVNGEGFPVGPDGRFQFAIPSGTYEMSVYGPGIEHKFFDRRLIEQDTDLGDLGMPSGSPVRIVFQMAGLTADAWKDLRQKVEVRKEGGAAGSGEEWAYHRDLPSPNAAEAGLLTWPAHPPGHYRITVEVPGFAAAGTEYLVGDSAKESSVLLQLFPCGSVRLRVQNPTEATGEDPLRLRLDPDEATRQSAGLVFQDRLVFSKFDEHEVAVGADGTALFTNLMPGLWRVHALPGDGESTWSYAEAPPLGEVAVEYGVTAELSVRVAGFARLRLQVVDKDGMPVRNAIAGIRAVERMNTDYQSPNSVADDGALGGRVYKTDQLGLVSFDRVSFGEYLVCAQRDESAAAAWMTQRADQELVECTLRLAGGTVSVAPRRADGSIPAEGEVGLIAEAALATSATAHEDMKSRRRGQVCEYDIEDGRPPFVFRDVAPGRYRAYLRVRARFDEIGYGWSEVFEVTENGLSEPIAVVALDTPELHWSCTGNAAWYHLKARVLIQREGDGEPWDDYPLWEDDAKPQELDLPLPAGIWTARLVTPDGVIHATSPPFRHGPGEPSPPPWTLPPPR